MGREFDQLFDQWAPTYDHTVSGHDEEYRDVFLNYDEILTNVANKAKGTVIEFGVGTGNLTKKLLDRGLNVIGVEPSQKMREITKNKMNFLPVEGDFLHFPIPDEKVDSIVSTYAFHHLTDEEKDKAISYYSSILSNNGAIIIADTIFSTEEEKVKTENYYKQKGYDRLVHDLQTEYYTTIPLLTSIFEKHGFNVRFDRMNHFVWIAYAKKRNH
mgnify:CR=1 FL=1